jgi:LCP family protein required for cell wall assembly
LILPDKIPNYGKEAKTVAGQFNLLVAGKNGGLVDTMILANINPQKGKITLVSIPRDLFYKSRKINSFYSAYGMEELKRALSTITGYKIDKYILVDMYVFIDIINIIGGIDVHLGAPVIDPTYKTCDGGVCSTLYYRAGDHHLNGKQALRLARTRHTSSDFARAERQQMILGAIKQKAQKFGFGDANNLRKIAQTVLAKTETDISLPDAISYYFRYQNLQLSGGHVLSSGNVLESKFSGDLKPLDPKCTAPKPAQPPQEGQPAPAPGPAVNCKKERGQYILLPRGGNWNTIKWFFHQIIEGTP